VTLEVALVSRYWTVPFFIFTVLSYVLVFPFQARAPSLPGPVPGSVSGMVPGTVLKRCVA